MFCTNCGAKLTGQSTYCPVCGAVIASGEAVSEAEKKMTGNEAEEKAKEEKKEEKKEDKFPDMLIDPDEEQIAVLGSGYLNNLLHGNGLREGFGILTDKRLYFKGKCYMKSAGGYDSVKEEYSVDLEDITATGFTERNNSKLIILAGIVFIVCLLSRMSYAEGLAPAFLLCSLGLVAAYFITRKIYYEISFSGGSICVAASTYGGIEKVRVFNKALRQEKDKHRQNAGKLKAEKKGNM